MIQPCMQRHFRQCAETSMAVAKDKKTVFVLAIISIILSSSHLNKRILSFIVHYLQERCFQPYHC